MLRPFADWMQYVAESLIDSVTCEQPNLDPAEVLQEAEQRLIEATGFNLNDKEVTK